MLILARDDVVAALLGLMVELQGFSPRFPARGEAPMDALAHDRFAAVVIDCDHPDCSGELLALIRTTTAQPILFSPFRLSSEVVEFAARHGAKVFTLPTDPETFGKMLEP